jgi:hypothetical protein
MTTLLEIREDIKNIYGRFSAFILPAVKFLLALTALLMINSSIGYNKTLAGMIPSLILALLSALMPVNAICAVMAVVILAHLYSLSIVVFGTGAVLFLLMFLLYFRFSPNDGILVLLTPIAMKIGIPYVIPLSAGLFSSPVSALAAAIGTIVFYFLSFISENGTTVSGSGTDELISSLRFILDGLMKNRTMVVMAAALVIGLILVFFIRRLRIAHAWSIAVISSAVVMLIILLAGDMAYDTNLSIGLVFFGMIISILIAEVLIFFFFNLDYSRIESVQFEDDDYYYYVKAVPKVIVPTKERTVTRFSKSHGGSGRGGYSDSYGGSDDFDYQNIDDAIYDDEMEKSDIYNSSADSAGQDGDAYGGPESGAAENSGEAGSERSSNG